MRADLRSKVPWPAGLIVLFAFCFFTAANQSVGQEVLSQPVSVSSRQITEFRIGSRETRFGAFEFVGGLEMTSEDPRFSGMSSFRFLSPGNRFIGTTDTGFWYFGTLQYDEYGRPAGMQNFTIAPIQISDGAVDHDKWFMDAEALVVKDSQVVVGFERTHRIEVFEFDPLNMGPPVGAIDFLIPRHELRINQGFETIALAPDDSGLAGALVAVTERSLNLNQQASIFAAVLSGPRKGVFSVTRSDDFDVTDGAFLPNGDLLLLERRLSYLSGVAMRIRRIDQESIRPGVVVDGPVLLEADMGYQIDNMEALEVWEDAGGQTMISLISDDNRSFLQRNLYLEFRLVEN